MFHLSTDTYNRGGYHFAIASAQLQVHSNTSLLSLKFRQFKFHGLLNTICNIQVYSSIEFEISHKFKITLAAVLLYNKFVQGILFVRV